MKSLFKHLFMVSWVVFFSIPLVSGQTMQPQKIDPEKQTEVINNCNAFLDKFVGNWVAEYTDNNIPVKADLSWKRIIQNEFLEGYLKVTDKSGKIMYEAKLVMTFNRGGMQYLMYLFESTGWAKVFIGQASPVQIQVQGILPEGFEYFRWQITPDGNLERAHWDPVPGKAVPEGDPQQVIVFKKA